MPGDERPLYVSQPSWRSLGQEYRVYPDRMELQTLLGRIAIPFADIAEVEVRPPPVVGDAFRGKPLAYWFALKLDLADLSRHVAIYRKRGIPRNIRITPQDPEEFVAHCRPLLKRT